MSGQTPEDAYVRGKPISETYNPGLEDALRARYDALLPGMARSMVEVPWGHFYNRGVVDEKTRFLATIAGLTALGGQTRPQLKVHVASARRAGASREEIAEIIFQMAMYGGFPSAINALNAALEVFEAEEGTES
ncbi:MAG: carboxymuconolactone decarboxylase family protein [Pseudomonadota bacterium]